MSVKFTDRELSLMSPSERDRCLGELVEATKSAPDDALLRSVNAEIAALEKSAGITSNELHDALDSGERRETWEVCQWLMLLHRRTRLEAIRARGGSK